MNLRHVRLLLAVKGQSGRRAVFIVGLMKFADDAAAIPSPHSAVVDDTRLSATSFQLGKIT